MATPCDYVLNSVYGFEPLGLSWKKSGVNAAAPMPPKMAIVAAVPSPKSPPPPPPAAAGAVAATLVLTVGAAAPWGKQTFRTPPAAGSFLAAVPWSVAISPVVFFFAVRTAQP